MKVLVITDDRVGPVMAGTALRAWELARTLLAAGHEVILTGAPGSGHPEGHGPRVAARPPWRWADAVVAAPWSLPPRAFVGGHLLIVDGVTPLLAELAAMPATAGVLRRRRTAAARLPLVAARADAVLVAGEAQRRWWRHVLGRRPAVPVVDLPFGVPDTVPPAEHEAIAGVPPDWAVVLWWGGVWPWLDLETLLAARARLGSARVSLVVPTSTRPGASEPAFGTNELQAAAARHGLRPPQVVPLETWTPYARRHRILNRASLVAVLHRSGAEAELSFRTRVLDALWAAVPVLLTEGGAVAELARVGGWGGVVPPAQVEATAATLHLLLGPRQQETCRAALARQRQGWRWSEVSEPLIELLPELPQASHSALPTAAIGALSGLLGRPVEVLP